MLTGSKLESQGPVFLPAGQSLSKIYVNTCVDREHGIIILIFALCLKVDCASDQIRQ